MPVVAAQQTASARPRSAIDVAELDPLDQAVDDLADAVLELLVLALAFGVAHLLDDHLLGGLRRDATEVDGRQGIDQEVAELRVRLALARRHPGSTCDDLVFHFGSVTS